MPKVCNLEKFRLLLGVDCDTAIVVANVIGIALFLILTVIGLVIVKRKYDLKVRATRERMEELGLLEQNASWLCLDQWEVSRDHVVLNRKLGEGAFGTVYGGEALIEDVWVAVAVKTLKIGSNPEEKVRFAPLCWMIVGCDGRLFTNHRYLLLLHQQFQTEIASAVHAFFLNILILLFYYLIFNILFYYFILFLIEFWYRTWTCFV